jgi:[methyl-Co(III) methanol-specific corrinoid protein]:coenzyme M methyltransferase|tara:strand:- start:102 stop:1112 length:1011 start_codon:yes stop_codon:yes gene_type:complete
MTPKDRLVKAIKLEKLDRPPITCFNQTVTLEQMENVGVFWPEAHKKADKMALLAAQVWEQNKLEGIGVPFCQTVEPEILGCNIKWELDKKESIPATFHKGFGSVDDIDIPENFTEKGRMAVVLDAIEILDKKYGDTVPVMGRINGPLSLSAALAEVVKLLKFVMKDPDKVKEFNELSLEILKEYGNAMYDRGAFLVCVEDMVASPDIIGNKFYGRFALPHNSALIKGLNGLTALHICGNTEFVIENMAETSTDIISIDSKANLTNILAKLKGKVAVAGNVDTISSLMHGTTEDVNKDVKRCIEEGVDIVTPGCAIPPLTLNKNVRAMVDAAVNHPN